MTDLYRGAVCRINIVEGAAIMQVGQEHARRLYNFAWWCAIGSNRKTARARGIYSLAGKLPKYPGYIGMWQALHDTDEYRVLSDRVASYILRGLDASIRSWFSNLKSNPKARPPRYRKQAPPLVFEVGRNAKHLGGNLWRFSVLTGSNPERYAVCRVYLPPLTSPERVASIKVLADGRCAVSYLLRQKAVSGNAIAGIDLGVRRMATVAFQTGESIMYTGAPLLMAQQYFQKRVAACMPSGYEAGKDTKGWSSVKKGHYATWAKQKRLMLHSLSESIVRECRTRGVAVIVIGDLKGIRDDKDFGKQTNQQLHAWPFRELTTMLTYKAEEHGIRVVPVKERGTSRTCCLCGHVNKPSARKERGRLTCASCGAIVHADVNGAFNILNKYLPEETLGVVGGLPARPSPAAVARGAGESRSQIDPTFVAKFDLRTFAVQLRKC